MKLSDFEKGLSFDAHDFFGAHRTKDGIAFRAYAPHAAGVALISECTGWNELNMKKYRGGIFEAVLPYAQPGQLYKFAVYSKRGVRREHCDPYGTYLEKGRGHCSIIQPENDYTFHDRSWMKSRTLNLDKPMNIYEMHIGSWKKKQPGGWEWYSYTELAEPLIRHCMEYSYTHVEFLPLSEHPTDGSMGYQSTGFFSPTNRYGTPAQFKELIDKLHMAGIGIILDFVSVHFAVDSYGLAMFDGSSLYEPSGQGKRRSEWGSYMFDHNKGSVRSFLQSAATNWAENYHVDGLRFDAVSHLVYCNGKEKNGEYTAGIEYLKNINEGLRQRFPTLMLIAEDSTAYPKVTHQVEDGGLGFDYKWALGWTHDTLNFFTSSPIDRSSKSHYLTYPWDYFKYEHFMLTMSHDEVSGNQKSLADKMPGNKDERLCSLKLMAMYIAMHPGKKLTFMGSEFASPGSWNPNKVLEWQCLTTPSNRRFAEFICRLNRITIENSALYEADYEEWGFKWLRSNDNGDCVYAMIRHSSDDHAAAVMNFSDSSRDVYIPLTWVKKAQIILHTDWKKYGGTIKPGDEEYTIDDNGIHISMLPLSGVIFEIEFK